MLLLIERSKCWRCCWSKGQSSKHVAEDVAERCCWSKGQSVEDVANRKVKVLKMLLLIKRSKFWRFCCWSKDLSAEHVVVQKVKVLKMLLKMLLKVLLIKRSKCCRCCWSKGQKMLMLIKELLSLKIEDEDYMMLKSFQWFIDVLPWWCWWCPLLLLFLLL